jgi:hypothetical protein
MSLATLPKSRAYVVVTYTAIDERTLQFETLRFRVSPEVAEALADEGAPLREVTFTDLLGKRRPGEGPERSIRGLAPEKVLRGQARRIARRRLKERGGSSWEGPRPPKFTRIIGATHIWSGPPRRYQFCGGRRLEAGEICLDCDRAAREQATPEREEPRTRVPLGPNGDRLKGGKG